MDKSPRLFHLAYIAAYRLKYILSFATFSFVSAFMRTLIFVLILIIVDDVFPGG